VRLLRTACVASRKRESPECVSIHPLCVRIYREQTESLGVALIGIFVRSARNEGNNPAVVNRVNGTRFAAMRRDSCIVIGMKHLLPSVEVS